MHDFNESKDDYRATIDEGISFIGADHDFFIVTKGDMINELIADRLPTVSRARILDVGCGHGYVHPKLVEAGHQVTGVEIAEQVIEVARKANAKVDYRTYDGTSLPFPDSTFDVAIAMCVMHHVPPSKWGVFVREMRRVVRPGGFIAVFEHNPINPLTQYVVASSKLDVGVKLVRRRRLVQLFRAAGISKVRSAYIFFTPFGHRLFRWLDKKLAWMPLGAQYLTVAER
jgi:SAM-dependent methyltransferase